MAAKQAPSMFGKPLTEAQLLERFQSCLKTSAQGVKFLKLKATLANVRFWDCEGKRAEVPDSLRGRRILAAVQPRQLWVMNQQCGLLLELRDVKLDEGVEECPLKERGAAAAFGPASPKHSRGLQDSLIGGPPILST